MEYHYFVIFKVTGCEHEKDCSKIFINWEDIDHLEIKHIKKNKVIENINELNYVDFNTSCCTGHRYIYKAMKILGQGDLNDYKYLL